MTGPSITRRRLLRLAGIAGVAGVATLGGTRASAANRYYRGAVSDHYDGTRFFNPGGAMPGGMWEALRWKFSGNRSEWPEAINNPPQDVPDARVDRLRVTMVGHATMLVQAGGLNILTDPLWSQRASPFGFAGPRRVRSPGIAFDRLPPIDVVLLSHNHYDHLDIATLKRIHAKHNPLVVTPLGNDRIVQDAAPAMRVVAGDWGDRIPLPGGGTAHIEPAHHWSARGLGDRRMALWASFVIEAGPVSIYFVGDTGFHNGINYRAVGAKHPGLDLAILPIGAYAPRWFMKAQHQDPDEAVAGMRLCGAAHAIGHHWATIQLTDEAIDEPRQRLTAALAREGLASHRFRPLLPGERWDMPA